MPTNDREYMREYMRKYRKEKRKEKSKVMPIPFNMDLTWHQYEDPEPYTQLEIRILSFMARHMGIPRYWTLTVEQLETAIMFYLTSFF